MNVIKVLMDLVGFMKNSHLTEAQMKELQNRKLREMLRFAWNHSAFYRRTFEKAGITEEQLDGLPLSAFPTIDKQILIEHFDELITVSDAYGGDQQFFLTASYLDCPVSWFDCNGIVCPVRMAYRKENQKGSPFRFDSRMT